MSEAPQQRGGPPRQVIALRASALLAESIKSSLRGDQVEFLDLEELVADAADADLLICEPAENNDALVERVLAAPQLADVPTLFIGPPDSPLLDPRRPVHELSADVSVSEVARLARRLLFGHAPDTTGIRPSAPFSVVPPGGELAGPDEAVSDRPQMRSKPAPLLPTSPPPSSRPHSNKPRQLPTIPPALVGRPSDELASPPTELSSDLSQLLRDVEQRIALQLRPRSSIPAVPDCDGAFPMTPELEAALADPIGDESADPDAHPSLTTGTDPRTTGIGHSGARSIAGFGDSLPPKTRQSSALLSTLANTPTPGSVRTGESRAAAHEAQGAAHSLTVTTRPPSRGTAAPSTAFGGAPQSDQAFDDPSFSESSPPPSYPRFTPPAPAPEPTTARPPSSLLSQQSATLGGLPAAMPPAPALPHELEPTAQGSQLVVPPALAQMHEHAVNALASHQGAETRRPPKRPASTNPPSRLATEVPEDRNTEWLDELSLHAAASRPISAQSGELPVSENRHLTTIQHNELQHNELQHNELQHNELQPSQPQHSESFGDAVQLGKDAALASLARAIRTRQTGVMEYESHDVIRRVVLRDGDLVTAASSARNESLVAYLVGKGTLSSQAGEHLGHRVPSFGRHASAALIAGGHLPQHELWPTLRSHAEFVVSRILVLQEGIAVFEELVPERLKAEPSVFGGATGSEVLVELSKRTVNPSEALERLGGANLRIDEGDNYRLLEECALTQDETATLTAMLGNSLASLSQHSSGPEFVCILYALWQLTVIGTTPIERTTAAKKDRKPAPDPLDAQALREAILVRRRLVDDADYFSLLGIPRGATGYDIRRAYLELRRTFDPSRTMTNTTLDLRDDVSLILEVLDEAYDILRDASKRERYRRAIESIPA